MNILIIGANSEISHYFKNYCENKGHEVFIITRNKELQSINNNKLIVEDYLVEKEKIKHFIKELKNPVVIFFNGVLFENRPFKTPTQEEIKLTNYVNFTVPYELYKYIDKSKTVKKFVFMSSMAAIRLRNKNYVYGKSKQNLEKNVLESSKNNILIIRFGKVFTSMSKDHKTPPFSMTPNKAALKVYKSLHKENIIYGNLGLNVISKLIKITPDFVFRKVKI